MGMFDDLKCEYPLPDPEVQDKWFQTKDFNCHMDKYTITKEGRLIWHQTRYEDVPEEERPNYGKPAWDGFLGKFQGSIRAVPVADIDMQYHGVVNFYTSSGDYKKQDFVWYEYEAIFTHGQVEEIRRIKEQETEETEPCTI
jgi:hypothetical protein